MALTVFKEVSNRAFSHLYRAGSRVLGRVSEQAKELFVPIEAMRALNRLVEEE